MDSKLILKSSENLKNIYLQWPNSILSIVIAKNL